MYHLLTLVLFGTLFGLCIGSFLNVVIYRLPQILHAQYTLACQEQLKLKKDKIKPLSLATPRSHCPYCKKTIPIWLNLPIIGFLLAKARCQHCQHRISLLYPLVELLGGLSAGVTLYYFGLSAQALGLLVFIWLAIPLFFIDIQHQLLPDNLTLLGLWLGLFFNLFSTFSTIESAVIGAMVGYLSLWLIGQVFRAVRKMEGIGYGDFKLCAMLGAWLGWQLLPYVLLLASLLGLGGGIVILLYKKQGVKTTLAFGPYLIIAGFVFLIWKLPIHHLNLFR